MRLVEALEAAPAAVVAVVAEPRQIDAHGYTARLAVESALAGRVPAGAELRIGWEELATSRAPRFADGERVLLALEPLPGDSIWATRFPDPVLRSRVFGVSMRGDAFLRAPSPRAVERLEHYLKLAASDREGANGAALLAELAADTEPPLAVERRGAARAPLRARRQRSIRRPRRSSCAPCSATDAGPALSAALLEIDRARAAAGAARAARGARLARAARAGSRLRGARGARFRRRARARGAAAASRLAGASGGRGAARERAGRAGELARLARSDPDAVGARRGDRAPGGARRRLGRRGRPIGAARPGPLRTRRGRRARSARSARAPSPDCGEPWIRATRTRRAPPSSRSS